SSSGEKNAGFDVLYHNMKHGQIATKELAEFVRERAAVEETYSKSMSKLAKMASNGSQLGTFAPMWDVFRVSSDKLALCHLELMRKMNDLIRDINKYSEEQVKVHRKTKEEVVGTLEAVQALQVQSTQLQKSREGYHTRCIELDRMRKEGVPQKELEKAEHKSKKSAEVLTCSIEKYNRVGGDFEQKMSESAQKFQVLEETHLSQMKQLIRAYSHSIEDTHVQVGQVHEEFKQNVENIGIENLIQKFTEVKGTGKERPGSVGFEDFLPSFGADTEDKENNFYSSDSDADEEEPKKFHIQIRPVGTSGRSNSAANELELKATVGALTLPPNRGSSLAATAAPGNSSHRPNPAPHPGPHPAPNPTQAKKEAQPWSSQHNPFSCGPRAQAAGPEACRMKQRSCEEKPRRNGPPLTRHSVSYPLGYQYSLQLIRLNDATNIFFTAVSQRLSPVCTVCSETPVLYVCFLPFISSCLVKITGDLTMSFPAGITRLFTANPNAPVLSFRLLNISRMDHFLPNQKLLYSDPSQTDPDSRDFWFNMPALTFHLQKEAELSPQASYHNVGLLKYQVHDGNHSCQRSGTVTRVSLDYHCCPATAPAAQLTAVQVLLPLDHAAADVQCQPPASWNAEERRLLWKLPNLSPTNHSKGSGTLCASWQQCTETSRGPPPSLAVQFVGSGASLSGVDVELLGKQYRMSLVKKRFATGKYMAGCSL
uniref:F-BAR domain only protein 1 n=1 Tax=Denticeps clupeoides TaxID=299321 RepID=A0AAY4DXX9_9TELE